MNVSNKDVMPQHTDLMNPLLKAMSELGGSANINEIYQKVLEIIDISDEIAEVKHKKGNRTEIEYRLAWARTYLKKVGILENSSRGIWALKNFNQPEIDPSDIVKMVRELAEDSSDENPENLKDDTESIEKDIAFEDIVLNKIMSLSPAAFERLTQRILRESGFVQVEVTGKSGDGGIDGKGIVKLNGIMSFHMMFQCKRYTNNSISSSAIRDFRGALQGRADKGLFITTSTFTRDASKEASRDGTTPIDLIDGDELVELMKYLKLGVKPIIKTEYVLDKDWFEDL